MIRWAWQPAATDERRRLDRTSAASLLRRAARDFGAMHQLRALLAQHLGAATVQALSDAAVLAALERGLARGELRVRETTRMNTRSLVTPEHEEPESGESEMEGDSLVAYIDAFGVLEEVESELSGEMEPAELEALLDGEMESAEVEGEIEGSYDPGEMDAEIAGEMEAVELEAEIDGVPEPVELEAELDAPAGSLAGGQVESESEGAAAEAEGA